MVDRFKTAIDSVFLSARYCFILFLFFSCSESSRNLAGESNFNSENYFSEEATRLSSLAKPVLKIVSRNSATDSARLTISDWKKELEPFRLCNIARPSMQNSYRVDSVPGAGNGRVTYTAIEPQLVIRTLDLDYAGGRIVAFHAVTSEKNELYATTRELRYVPDSGYRIRGRQEMRMGDLTDYVVTASWK